MRCASAATTAGCRTVDVSKGEMRVRVEVEVGVGVACTFMGRHNA